MAWIDPNTARLIPLKLKYRVRRTSTNKSPGSNTGTRVKNVQVLRPRRRAWGPW